jgi:hypothetical protein
MKKVAFKMPVKPLPVAAEDWIKGNVPAVPDEPMKRFTIDVPVDLHTRIKTQCAARGAKMADVLRDILEREFPKS